MPAFLKIVYLFLPPSRECQAFFCIFLSLLKKDLGVMYWWLMPVIPVTQNAEIRRIEI
jgi:hypothetical protein